VFPALYVPTATQLVVRVHDTLASWLPVALVGLGLVIVDQVVPFQCSTNVDWLLPPF